MRPPFVWFAALLASSVAWTSSGFGADAGVHDSGLSPGDAETAIDSGPISEAGASLPAPLFIVGKACAKVADCAPGLLCVLSTSNTLGGGAPANGLCTADCSAKGQGDCDAVDTGSLCVVVDSAKGTAFCYERCPIGAPATDLPKCHDRADMACAPNAAGAGYCAPTCEGDADCGSRKCNSASGLCVDTVERGTMPIGAACDPAATKNPCEGTCLTVGSGAEGSTCSHVCSIGAAGACAQDSKSTAAPTATCVPLIEQDEGVGDIGACAQLCSCDSDCHNPAFVCAAIGQGSARGCAPSLDANGATVPGLACGGPSDAGPSKTAKQDSGAPSADAGAEPHKKSSSGGGCGCRVEGTGENDTGGLAASLAAGVGMLLMRRRRHRRAC